jgi:hypothetical protein
MMREAMGAPASTGVGMKQRWAFGFQLPSPYPDWGTQSSGRTSRASGKRRQALPEGNPPSNTRRARLQTAAEGGEKLSSPPAFSPLRILYACQLQANLPVVGAIWLQNSQEGDCKGGGWNPPPLRRASAGLPLTPGANRLQACLIACNLRHGDALPAESAVQPRGGWRP